MPSTRSTLKLAKLGLLRTAKRSGLMSATRDSRWRTRRLLILAYHSISLHEEHEFSPELYLPLSGLRYRFELLRQGGYSVIPLREALGRLTSGTLPPRAVALTFDDGTYDFKEAVVPLLQEFRFPATVYLTTYYAAREAPVFRMACRYLLWYGRNLTIPADDLTSAGGFLTLDSLNARERALEAIEAHVESRDGGLKEELATLERLASLVGVDFSRFREERRHRLMSEAEVRAMPADLVDVQLHTHRHRVPLRRDGFEREISDNRALLRAWRPDAVLDGFCYPSGVTDPRFPPWLRDLGITAATTCMPGLAHVTTDPLMLPRLVDSWRMTELELEGWLTGLSHFLPRIPRRERYRPNPVYD